MKRTFLLTVLWSFCTGFSLTGQDMAAAAKLFSEKCGICHTIGQGKLIGPDLSGVQERRSEEWLLRFIRSSQAMINSGDPDAVALFAEFNKVVMPDPMISDGEIKSILQHIAQNPGSGAAPAAYESILTGVTAEEVERGKKLFDGRIGFANGGPTCVACHNGISGTYFNQRSYAKDLGASFVTLGEQGVRTIIENPPFPVMKEAFDQKPLTQEETRLLLAYLGQIDPEAAARAAGTPGSGFIMYGLMGAATLIILFSGLWYNRKSQSVNYRIYERQMKSAN
ncbi:MAG: hypothetical protein KIPDCIKN_00900 [Haliscomenobacter sp.]|jgi:mono/diheme cytochrome c family protein|nr:hypothetical protein [Haliscomenobacter sp.]